MDHNTLFKLIYTFILGVFIALLFGVGTAAFYEAPKAPEYPVSSTEYKMSDPTVEEQKAQKIRDEKFQSEMKDYDTKNRAYSKNVSIILLVLAVFSVVIAFAAVSIVGFLSDGILLGGLFTLLHGLVRGFAADDNKYLFVATTIAVAVVLYLGYRRFIQTPRSASAKPTKK